MGLSRIVFALTDTVLRSLILPLTLLAGERRGKGIFDSIIFVFLIISCPVEVQSLLSGLSRSLLCWCIYTQPKA